MKIILMNIIWIFVLKLMKEKTSSFNVMLKNVQPVKQFLFLMLCMVLLMEDAQISSPLINVSKKLIHLLTKNVMMLLIVNLKLMLIILKILNGQLIGVIGNMFLDVEVKKSNYKQLDHVNVQIMEVQEKQKKKNKKEKKKLKKENQKEKPKDLVKINNKSPSKMIKDIIYKLLKEEFGELK